MTNLTSSASSKSQEDFEKEFDAWVDARLQQGFRLSWEIEGEEAHIGLEWTGPGEAPEYPEAPQQ